MSALFKCNGRRFTCGPAAKFIWTRGRQVQPCCSAALARRDNRVANRRPFSPTRPRRWQKPTSPSFRVRWMKWLGKISVFSLLVRCQPPIPSPPLYEANATFFEGPSGPIIENTFIVSANPVNNEDSLLPLSLQSSTICLSSDPSTNTIITNR